MKPWELLDRVETPEGTEMALLRRGDEYVIRSGGRDLMSSRMHGSEEALATMGCERARTRKSPCVLVGGLGMGFTLRATLDLLPPGATVVVSELLESVVAWNRTLLGGLAGNPLDDPRVRVEVGDVRNTMRAGTGRFDAVLLDVDNGPEAFTQEDNERLYDDAGLAIARKSLRSGGTLAVWSARGDLRFEKRLRRAGFAAESVAVRARLKQGGPRHTIFLARI